MFVQPDVPVDRGVAIRERGGIITVPETKTLPECACKPFTIQVESGMTN